MLEKKVMLETDELSTAGKSKVIAAVKDLLLFKLFYLVDMDKISPEYLLDRMGDVINNTPATEKEQLEGAILAIKSLIKIVSKISNKFLIDLISGENFSCILEPDKALIEKNHNAKLSLRLSISNKLLLGVCKERILRPLILEGYLDGYEDTLLDFAYQSCSEYYLEYDKEDTIVDCYKKRKEQLKKNKSVTSQYVAGLKASITESKAKPESKINHQNGLSKY